MQNELKIFKNKKISKEQVLNNRVNYIFSNQEYFRCKKNYSKENRRTSLEVKKVFASCHIVIFILDIRNPIGTWPHFLSQKKKYRFKKILLILNKCDLVPFWVLEKWIKIFSKNFLVFGFFCKKKKITGKRKILCVLTQIKKKCYPHKKKIFVGVIGYPNVGKSSFINALLGKKCLDVSPVPGQTKVWQFVKLSKNIFLIDSPGIIPEDDISETMNIIKGTMRSNRDLYHNAEMIKTIISKLGKRGQCNLKNSKSKINGFQMNKNCILIKGSNHDEKTSLNKIIREFVSGIIPWFSPIPSMVQKKSFPLKIKKWSYIAPYF